MANEELICTLIQYCCSDYGEILGTKQKERVCKWIWEEIDNRGVHLIPEKLYALLGVVF